MKKFAIGVQSLIVVLCLAVSAWAQSRSTGGSIEGTVKDPSGAVVAGATVTAKNILTGLTRSVTTGEGGEYRMPALDVGKYEVSVEASGFSGRKSQIELLVGQTATLDFALTIGQGNADVVTVTAETAPIVEIARTQQSSTVNERAVKDLPVNGRNFLEFIRLTPGINVDPRGGDYSAGGLRGTLNSLLIDGADNNNTFFGQTLGRTGVRAPYQFSQSSVKEFQVNTNSFAAEFGRAGGALVNVVTKSGTNEFHGEAFEYFRDRSLNATDGFLRANNRPKPNVRINQFGASVGGPVKRDKLFFFFTYDGQRRTDPIQPVLVPAPPATLPAQTLSFLNSLTATYPQQFNQDVYMGKVDWQVNGANRVSVRYNRQLFTGTNLENGGTNRAQTATGNSNSTTDTITGSLTSVITPTVINEVRGLFSRDQQLGTANSDAPEVTILEGGNTAIVFGRNFFSPRETTEKRGQIIDTLTYVRGNHTYKFGIDFVFNRIFNFFPGTFNGRYQFLSYNSFAQGRPDGFVAYQQAFAGPNTNGPNSFPDTNEYSFFVQDEWNITRRFKLYYGLRYDSQIKAVPPVLNEDPRLTSRGIRTNTLNQDKNNFAPRVGFAWNLFGDNKTVVRGGYGIFYGRTPSIVTGTAHTQNGLSVRTVTFTPAQFQTSGLTFPQTFPNFPTAGTVPPLELFFFAPDYVDPLVHQASLGVERELTKDLSLSVSYLFTRGTRLTRTRDVNLAAPVPTVFNVRADLNAAAPLLGTVTLPRFGARPIQGYGRLFQFESTGDSVYHALAVQLTKRFSHNVQALVAYTWSKAIDNRPDATIVTAGDSARQVQNPLSIRDDRSASDVDIPHRFVASAVWDLNYAKGLGNSFAKAVLDGWSVSGIVTVASGQNYSALAGGDVNNDGGGATDRAPILGTNFQTGRNTFKRPTFASVDFRLTRAIKIKENYRIELFAEAFNFFNRFNPSGVFVNQTRFNANIGGVPTFAAPLSNQPFGGISGPGIAPRNFQLAAKFVF